MKIKRITEFLFALSPMWIPIAEIILCGALFKMFL